MAGRFHSQFHTTQEESVTQQENAVPEVDQEPDQEQDDHLSPAEVTAAMQEEFEILFMSNGIEEKTAFKAAGLAADLVAELSGDDEGDAQ